MDEVEITQEEAEYLVTMVQEGVDAGMAGTAVELTARGIVARYLMLAGVKVVQDA